MIPIHLYSTGGAYLDNNSVVVVNLMYDGSNTRFLQKTENLDDLNSKSTARTNLDVDSKGEVDTKISNHNNLTAITSPPAHGLGSAAMAAAGDFAPIAHVGSAATSAHSGLGSAAAAATTDFDAAGAASTVQGNLNTHTGTAATSAHSGLGDAATKNVGTTAGTVCAGDDSRLGGGGITPDAVGGVYYGSGEFSIDCGANVYAAIFNISAYFSTMIVQGTITVVNGTAHWSLWAGNGGTGGATGSVALTGTYQNVFSADSTTMKMKISGNTIYVDGNGNNYALTATGFNHS